MTFIPFSFPFSALAIALFIYYTSVSAGTEENKKQECSLARKGHGNWVIVCKESSC